MIGFVIFLGFGILTLPAQSAQTEVYSHGSGSPDTSLFYSGTKMIQMAEAYGEEGRAAYLKARWTFDLAFPVVYTFFMITSISFLFTKLDWNNKRIRIFNLTPLAAMAFDFAENTAASTVMAEFPRQNTWGQLLAPIFTPIKWLFVILSLLLILIGCISWVIKRINNRRR